MAQLSLIRTFHRSVCFHYKIKGKHDWLYDEKCVSKLEQLGLPSRELLKAKDSLPSDFSTLYHSALILEETGIAATVANLKRFRDLFHSDIAGLLKFKLIASNDVTSRFLQCLGTFPYNPSLRMPSLRGIAQIYMPIQQYHRRKLQASGIVDWPEDVEEEKEMTLKTERRRVLRQYYAWRLEADLNTIDMHMYNYSKITGLRGLRSLRSTLDILEHQVKLPKSKILRNFFLLSITPERLTDVIDNVTKIGATDLKTAVAIVPKILAKTSQEINETERILKEYNISDDCSTFRVHVQTLKPSTIRARVKQVADSDLVAFLDHPRCCELLFYFSKAWHRKEEIQRRGLRCMSLNVLIANEKVFQNFLNDGVDRTKEVTDICYMVAGKLGITKADVASPMSKHPFRFYVPLAEVKETLETLLEKGFSKEVILEAAPLLLYPREKILETLDMISTSDELEKMGFAKGFTAAATKFPTGTTSTDKRLVLCLYFLEKPYHFTGEGAMRVSNKTKALSDPAPSSLSMSWPSGGLTVRSEEERPE